VEIITAIDQMQARSLQARCAGRKIGFVPTMGYLHEGHLSLVRLADQLSQLVVVSVFVNPTQFGPQEDFRNYPRDLDRDTELVRQAGCDILFIPAADRMYPPEYRTFVEVEGLTGVLCGASRPGHFRGVTTVVTKLFLIVRPHLAVFGQKDAQQALVIRRMVSDLNQDVDIVVAPTVRESDGLAMSSRNKYLTPQQRSQAPALYRSLQWAQDRIAAGERSSQKLIEGITAMIAAQPAAQIDYVAIVDTEQLQPLETLQGEVLIALAVRFGRARLIDNAMVQVKGENG
jgi:pantoate--beta-alanine ligase